ncbi:MAG: tetratricopeptide repeat protein [Planctomycetota bacterium]
MTKTKLPSIVLLLAMAAATGCQTGTGPYQPARAEARDPSRAAELTREAADILLSNPERAESLLREALTEDLYHGPAHNNLGVIFMQRDELYEAASEFEWARKLMPGHPDPRMNLALTLERAGRIDDAMKTYETALEVYPGHLPTIQAMTRLQLRAGLEDERTDEHLTQIVERSSDPEWREWARLRLAKRK